MNKFSAQSKGLTALLSLLSPFSQAYQARAHYRYSREPAGFKRYSEEAQRIKLAKAERKRAMRREKFARTFTGVQDA